MNVHFVTFVAVLGVSGCFWLQAISATSASERILGKEWCSRKPSNCGTTWMWICSANWTCSRAAAAIKH